MLEFPAIDPTSQLRLLKILPTSGEDDIAVEVTAHNLEDVTDRYSAISYVWGEASLTKQIRVNGILVHVRWNCWYALWQAKLKGQAEDAESQGILLWLDSICIDQACHSEKSQQVQLMGKIFSRAREVFACVGEEGPDSRRLESPDTEEGEEKTTAAKHFASRVYFERTWTTQECLLSKRVIVFIGGHRQTFSEIYDLLGLDMFDGSLTQIQFLYYDMKQRPRRPWDIADTLCQYSRRRSCFDPRDKIYGFLAMAGDAVHQRMEIDYEKPLMRVLLDYCCVYDVLFPGNPSDIRPPDRFDAENAVIRGSLPDFLSSIRMLCDHFRRSPDSARDFESWRGLEAYMPGVRWRQTEIDLAYSWSGRYHCVDLNRDDKLWGHLEDSVDNPDLLQLTISRFASEFLVPPDIQTGDVILKIHDVYLLCRVKPGQDGEFELLGTLLRTTRLGGKLLHVNGEKIPSDVKLQDRSGFTPMRMPPGGLKLHPLVLLASCLLDVTKPRLRYFNARSLQHNEIRLGSDVYRIARRITTEAAQKVAGEDMLQEHRDWHSHLASFELDIYDLSMRKRVGPEI